MLFVVIILSLVALNTIEAKSKLPLVALQVRRVVQQQQQQQGTAFRYGVIVDCGSSGTRAHIFRWPQQNESQPHGNAENLATTIEQLRNPSSGKPIIKQIRPGLSSVRNNPDTASDYMHPIMDFLTSNVPQEAQQDTPIFFLGTAGLRLLPHPIQKQILDDITSDLPREYPNFQNLFTRVISGIEEGAYQWLSVNTFADRLGPNFDLEPTTAKEFYCQAPRSRRYGLIEMGGASVQISYELSDQVDQIIRKQLSSQPLALRTYLSSQHELQLSPTKRRRVFSATFLGFGSNSARSLATSLLIREAGLRMLNRANWPVFYNGPNSTLLLEDPCLPIGSQETQQHSLELLLDRTRPIGVYDDIESGRSSAGDQSSFIARLYGGGNFAQCQRLLNRVLVTSKRELINCYNDNNDDEDQTPCTTHLLGTNFAPFHLFQFLGLSEFYYTTNLMLDQAGQFRLAPILSRVISICTLPYRTLLALYPDANLIDKNRVRQECFKATWMITLLQVGFRMPFTNDFQTVDEINGQTLDWTTGAMIVRLFDAKTHLDRVQAI